MESASSLPKRNRTWFRYSLRTLLLVITAFAISLGILTNRARKQEAAVVALESLGGHVSYDYQERDGLVPDRNAVPAEPAWLRRLVGDHFFVTVTRVLLLINHGIENEDLRHLAELPNLRKVYIYSNNIDDHGLKHLRKCTDLEFLYLGIPITDEGLPHLKVFQRLKYLHLAGPNGEPGTCRYPDAEGVIADMDQYNTNVTLEAIQKLHRELPSTTIVF